MAKNPFLPLYYNDLRGATQDWTDEEFGAYVRLLIYQWDKGFIPTELSRLVKIADSAQKNWPVLSQKFTQATNGFLQNSVMEKIRIKRDAFLKHQIENGIQGGRPKTQTTTQTKAKKKPLENEIENEKENEIENFEKSEKLLMPFTSENFRVLWQNWKKYRQQEFKQTYKSGQSEQAALAHLAKISGGIEETAKDVIGQSIANQWRGLFELKNLGYGKNGTAAKKVTGAELNEVFAKRYPQGG